MTAVYRPRFVTLIGGPADLTRVAVPDDSRRVWRVESEDQGVATLHDYSLVPLYTRHPGEVVWVGIMVD